MRQFLKTKFLRLNITLISDFETPSGKPVAPIALKTTWQPSGETVTLEPGPKFMWTSFPGLSTSSRTCQSLGWLAAKLDNVPGADKVRASESPS